MVMSSTTMRFKEKLAYIGIAMPVIAIIVLSLSITSFPEFSVFNNALSDIGVVYPSSYFFNTGVAILGIMGILFGISIFSKRTEDGYSGVGSLIMTIGFFSLICVGIFTLNVRNYHLISAGLFFILTPASIIMLGIGEMLKKENLGMVSIILGSLSFIIWFFPWPYSGIAIPEIFSTAYVMVSVLLFGLREIKERD